MRLKGVQNGGKQRTQRTKRTGGKSRPPIWPISPIGPISPHEKRYAGLVSKMRVMGVQNGGARFAEVESKKRGQVESGKTRKSPQTSQSSQYSQTHCADRVSKMCRTGVQNGGQKQTPQTKRTGEKSKTPICPIDPIGRIWPIKSIVRNWCPACPEC